MSKKPAPFVTQYAALPWRQSDERFEVLLITSRTNRKWMLPKGWPMKGKDGAAAAGIEAFEEAGVEGVVTQAPIGSFHYRKLLPDAEARSAQAVVYGLRVTRELDAWPEASDRDRRWFTLDEAANAVFEPTLSRFLRQVAKGKVSLAA
jgi:8-oxo-dGTP pyrophosphatase MutT (NUDIX family)